MNILKQLKLAALNQVAKSQTPSSLERCILAERIAARLVPQGNHIKLDHDKAAAYVIPSDTSEAERLDNAEAL